MRQKFLLTVSILTALVLSACGGDATPTLSADAIAQTAVAEAWLVITQTVAAAPTATPIPPTNTPEPTATLAPTLALIPIPTLPPATTAAEAVPTTDQCNQPPPLESKGTLTTVEFKNESDGQVNLAFGMNSPNDKGECVTYSFGLGRGDVFSAKVLTGCYWGYAWITGSEPSVARTGGSLLCLKDASLIYHVTISKETIVLK